ncbi:PHD finger protein 14 [Dissophora ornata]|nr:PHD finger protein 14 [Dissophora ornata]
MVPPQHYPPAFPPEYSGMPMMMMVEQQQQDTPNHSRQGRLAKDPAAHSQQRLQRQHQEHPQTLPLPPPPREGPTEDHSDPEPMLVSASGLDIAPPSDDQPISMAENSNPSQEQSHYTTHRTRQQSQGSLGQHGQSARPQRQRRATTGSGANTAAVATAATKGLKSSSSTPIIKNPSQQTATETDLATATQPPASTQLPYTLADNGPTQSDKPLQHQRKTSAGGGLALSFLLNSADPPDHNQIVPPQLEKHAIGCISDTTEEPIKFQNPQQEKHEQQQQAKDDVSLESKGAQFASESTGVRPDQAAATAFSEGHALEGDTPVEPVPIGTGLKRASRQMSSSNLSTSGGKSKDPSATPAKKKAKTEPAKRGENDTASLFQKIFADRDPGKRKIKTKSVHEIPMDLAADEDDSDFEDTKADSNDEDEDMVIPEDAASEDEIRPDQEEAFNEEQDLLTALWQWANGAFRRLIPEDPSSGWVHVVCALWLPETTLGDPDNVDRISVRDIPEKNWNLTCYICSDPQDAALGACVQCDAGQCRKSFHITCAQGYSLLETIEDSDMADPYFMYCKQHGSTDGHPKLNGWAKWVKQRDAFLKKWQDDQGRKRTKRLIEAQQNGDGDEDGGEGLVEFFEHSYSRFKQAREKRIAKERSELSRQYSIGYYLGNKIDKSRSRLDVISSKAAQALLEQRRIEMHTRNLLSSLLECANYLENVSAEQLEAPLSIDTTMAWYNALPVTSRWKSNIQDIIETIDIESLACDNPYTQLGSHGHVDSGLDDSEGGQRHGRSSKSIYAKLSKKGGKAAYSSGKNVKSKKVHPKPTLANKSQIPVVFTSSRGRQIKRDFSDPDECYSTTRTSESHYGADYHMGQSGGMSAVKIQRPVVPCTVCHQLTLPEDKLALERDANGVLSPMTIKVLNRMVACNTCQRQFHPKCLDPPMARVPPRGYSWNCEDCDSSEESHGSSGEASPVLSSANLNHQQHHHSHSPDLGEGLMVLADTAMTISANNVPYQLPAKALSHGVKRPLVMNGSEAIGGSYLSFGTGVDASLKSKDTKTKKVKTEGTDKLKFTKPKTKATVLNMDAKPKVKKMSKAKDSQFVGGLYAETARPNGSAGVSGQTDYQLISFRPAVAPIVRGNLRIYPPGPHIAPMISSALMKEVAINVGSTESEKPKVKKMTMAKTAPSTKQEAGATMTKKKVKSEPTVKTAGAKTKKSEMVPVPAKSKAVAATPKKKTAPKDLDVADASAPATVPKTTKAPTAGSKEKAVVRRSSLPAVPMPPPPKPKDVIRYTVGEKTVEELTAKEDVEIERRQNIKFRKLRGRTLTMPAPAGEAFYNSTGAGSE